LATSIDIHDVVTRDSWTDQPCNGGVFWSREYSYKNAITNELYFSAAARLFKITGNSTFLDRATKTLNWLQSSGMIQSNFQIVDGLANATCKAQGAVYTYNQGVLLGGLAELGAVSNATYKSELITLGENIANAVSTLMTDSNGILTEANCGDGALFKGIYTRYLRYFLDIAQPSSTDKLKSFLTAQSSSIWNAARDTITGFFAKQWVGPAGSKFHNLQVCLENMNLY
jgi:predicted alpha-1,6-mannanase (GH76 family)